MLSRRDTSGSGVVDALQFKELRVFHEAVHAADDGMCQARQPVKEPEPEQVELDEPDNRAGCQVQGGCRMAAIVQSPCCEGRIAILLFEVIPQAFG